MSKTDMVRAYTESLLEQMLGAERVERDDDGDYRVPYKSAPYFVRIESGRNDEPVVQVFAIALAGVTGTPELFEQLNGINASLRFARIFWVQGQVLVESHLPGDSLSMSGFSSACNTVGGAADYFGPRLASDFGGSSAFADEKGQEYEEPEYRPGLYL